MGYEHLERLSREDRQVSCASVHWAGHHLRRRVPVLGSSPAVSRTWSTTQPFESTDRALHHRHRWYHTDMEKTTLYLPDDLKAAVKRAAARKQISEAEVIC